MSGNVGGVRVGPFALYTAPAARLPFDVLHEPHAGHLHDAALANVTAHERGPHEQVALFKCLRDLVGVGEEVVFINIGRTLVPEPPHKSHVEPLDSWEESRESRPPRRDERWRHSTRVHLTLHASAFLNPCVTVMIGSLAVSGALNSKRFFRVFR